MKAVVFTEEPGFGKAFLATFDSPEEADLYQDQHYVMVMDHDELEGEVARLRRWVKSAADEYNTASRKLRHAQEMLDGLVEMIENAPREEVS